MSDTRANAMIANTLGPNMFDHESGKWVLVTRKGINVYGASKFEKDDGILYSNSSYQSRGGCSVPQDWNWIRNKTTQVTISKTKETPNENRKEKEFQFANPSSSANKKLHMLKKGDPEDIYNEEFWDYYERWKNENKQN
jgi:hypothetical protein